VDKTTIGGFKQALNLVEWKQSITTGQLENGWNYWKPPYKNRCIL